MRKITILALNGAAATGITGPMDVFHLSDLNLSYTNNQEPLVHFQVKIASMNGKAVKCANRLYIEPHCSVHDVKDTELIISRPVRLSRSGGSNACFDLSLHIVEKLCGREVAVQYSKVLVHDLGRITQSPYVLPRFKKDHNDPDILNIQHWMEIYYGEAISIPELSSMHGISLRSLERRFKKATGDSPLRYLQKIRIEVAKGMLEKSSATFEEATYRVGYEDIRSFRKLFQRHTGLLPKEYQRIYQPPPYILDISASA